MSIIDDVPYYGTRMQQQHHHDLRLMRRGGRDTDESLVEHNIATMGLYDIGSDAEYGTSFPISPGSMRASSLGQALRVGGSLFTGAISSMHSFPESSARHTSPPPRRLSHHVAEARRALDHHHFAHDALVSPFGATLSEDPTSGDYIVEAPTPGIPKERLFLEAVGLRRLELTVTPAAASPGSIDDVNNEQDDDVPLAQMEEAVAAAMKRSVTLPADCDLSRTTCNYQDGVLRVSIPKAASSSLGLPVGAAHAHLLSAATEGRERLNAARSELRALEAAAKEADRELRSALEQSQRSQDRVRLAI